jgi:hypothetical protein
MFEVERPAWRPPARRSRHERTGNGIAGNSVTQRQQTLFMPLDDCFERFDDDERCNRVLQHSIGRVAKTEPADNDIEMS